MLCGALQTNTQNTANLSSGHRQTILMTNTVHKASSYLICTQSAFTMPAMISGALSVVSLFRPTLELNVHCQWWYLTTLSQQMLTAVKHVADDNFYRAMLCMRGICYGLCPSVRSSVRPSVTSRRSTKTTERRITQTTPHISFLTSKISAKFDRDHRLRGRQMQVGWVKIGDFRQIAGYISKTVQDRRMVSIKVE